MERQGDEPAINPAVAGQPNQDYDMADFVFETSEHYGGAAFDATSIYNAVKIPGTKDDKLIEVLGHRTRSQRSAIAHEYLLAYNVPMYKAVDKDTSGHYGKLVKALSMPYYIWLAKAFRKAVRPKGVPGGLGTKDLKLIDLVVSSSNRDLHMARDWYGRKYGATAEEKAAAKGHDVDDEPDVKGEQAVKNEMKEQQWLMKRRGYWALSPHPLKLVQDVEKDTSGNYESLLVACLRGRRDESRSVNEDAVRADCELLYKATQGRPGTTDDDLIQIFSLRSHAHIRRIVQMYPTHQPKAKDLMEVLAKETSGNYERLLLALCEDPATYWAKRVHSALARPGTHDALLRRTFMLNEYSARVHIANKYQELYGKSLLADIQSDTSFNYKKVFEAMMEAPISSSDTPTTKGQGPHH